MQLSPWTKVSLDKSLIGQLSPWTKVTLGLSSPWTKVSLANCHLGQKFLGQLSPWTIAPWTVVATSPSTCFVSSILVQLALCLMLYDPQRKNRQTHPLTLLVTPLATCWVQNAIIDHFQNKLGLNWAKLSSSWDWALLQLICIEQLENQSYCTR